MRTQSLTRHAPRGMLALVAPVVVSLVYYSNTAAGVDVLWNVAGPADWNNGADWQGGVVPSVGNTAVFNNGGTANITAAAPSPLAAFGDLRFGSVSGASGGTVNQSANSFVSGGWLRMDMNGSATSNYTISGGSATFNRAGVNEGSGSGTSTLSVSGGTFTIPQSGGGNGQGALFIGGKGIVNVSSGQLVVGGDTASNRSIQVGDADFGGNGGTGTAQLNISGTGVVTILRNDMHVGGVSPGVVNQSGGTVNLPAADLSSWLYVGAYNTGTYNLSGGTLSVPGFVGLGGLGTQVSNGTFNLNGGTATVGGVAGLFPSTEVFNFNGGTLRANSDQLAFMEALPTMTANVRNGGAIIDTNGFNITISQPLVHSTIGGDNATDGGLTKVGSGTLTLSAANTYTGNTRVNGGTLVVPTGGSVSSTGGVFVGGSGVAGQSGILTIDGSGSISESGLFPVVAVGAGGLSTGTLNIGTTTSGASLTTGSGGLSIYSTGIVNIGSGAITGTLNAHGSVNVFGGVLQSNNIASSLNQASGTVLTVLAGGRASFQGDYSTSDLTQVVTDAGSKLETLNGEVNVINGGSIRVQAGGLLSPQALGVGKFTASDSVVVDGPGSRVNVTYGTFVGYTGHGTITLQNGSTGNSFGLGVNLAATISDSSSGSLSVLSGSTITAMGDLTMLQPVNSDSFGGLNVAQSAGVTVDGTGSSLTLSPSAHVSIGQDQINSATLTVSNNGVFTVGTGGTTSLNATGVINISGGIVDLKTLNYGGGTVNFSSGALSFLGDLRIGVGGLLGQNLTLDSSKILNLSGTTTVDQFKSLTLSGGTLFTGNLLNNGTFNFTSGKLFITGGSGLTIGTGGALGTSYTLPAGTNLNVTNATTVNSGSSFTVNGGNFSSFSLTNNGSIASNGSFTVTSPTNAAGAVIDVTGGVFLTPSAIMNSGSFVLDGGIVNAAGGLFNNSGALFYVSANKTVALGSGPSFNTGQIQLGGGSALLSGTGTLSNTGLLHGDGIVGLGVTNNAGGEIRAEAGQRIMLMGANGINNGNINLQGGTAEFSQPLTVASGGQINGQGNLIVPVGSNTGLSANQSSVFGLSDNGTIQFSGGNTNIYGSVNLPGVYNGTTFVGAGSGKLLIGAGATVSFYGDVWNNGALFNNGIGSYAVFFGTVHGATSFTGGGTRDFEGTYHPGNSPAVISIGGDVVFGVASTLDVSIGGTTPGNGAGNYAQANVAGAASLGGTLDLASYNGFVPTSGDKFTIMTYASESGAFSAVTGASAAPGLTYNAVYLPTSLVILTTTNGEKTWGIDAGGNSSLGANWIGGVAPGGVGDSATFSTIITAPRTVTVDADTTVGTFKFDSPIAYTIAGPHTLTLQAAGSSAATINVLNGHGNGAHTISAPITLASDLNIAQNSTGTLRIAGPLNDSAAHAVNKSGAGVAEIGGVPTFGANTNLNITGGTLRFALASGSPTVGAGVQATVNGSATLELAGAASALSSGVHRAHILNTSSAAAGLLVSGTNQQVGFIDGSGSMQVDAGSDLTANHIVQSALVIGGAMGNPAIATIAASDTNGNPLGQTDVEPTRIEVQAVDSGPMITPGGFSEANSLPIGADGVSSDPIPAAGTPSDRLAVPEPSAFLLMGSALLLGLSSKRVLQRPHG